MISYDGLRTCALTEMGKGIKSKGKTDETQERYNTIPSHNKQVSLTRGNVMRCENYPGEISKVFNLKNLIWFISLLPQTQLKVH